MTEENTNQTDNNSVTDNDNNYDSDNRNKTIVDLENEYGSIEASEFVVDAFSTSDPDSVTEEDYSSEENDDATFVSRSLTIIRSVFKPVVSIAIVIIFVFLFFNFIFRTYVVDGLSMFPQFDDSDRVVLWSGGKTFSDIVSKQYVPERGEVLVFSNPLNENVDLIKRVIALPGERVVLKNGSFIVYNDENPDGFNPDSFHDAVLRTTSGSVDLIVPDEHIFVVGDNRQGDQSFDSRNGLGTVPLENIQGRLLLRFIPIKNFKIY